MHFKTFFPVIRNKKNMFQFCTILRFKYEVTKASENKIEFPRCRHYTWVCGAGGVGGVARLWG